MLSEGQLGHVSLSSSLCSEHCWCWRVDAVDGQKTTTLKRWSLFPFTLQGTNLSSPLYPPIGIFEDDFPWCASRWWDMWYVPFLWFGGIPVSNPIHSITDLTDLKPQSLRFVGVWWKSRSSGGSKSDSTDFFTESQISFRLWICEYPDNGA